MSAAADAFRPPWVKRIFGDRCGTCRFAEVAPGQRLAYHPRAMEPQRTRKDQKAATREALRLAALRCFERKGFAATSIAEITSEADVAKGTFYVHYPDKTAVLDEALEAFNAALAAKLATVLAEVREAPLEQVVEALAVAFLDHWMGDSAFVRAFAERTAAGLDVHALPFGLNEPTRNVLVAALVLRLGPRAAEVDAELAIHAIVAMWLRLGLQLVFRKELDPRRVVDVLVPLTTGAVMRLVETSPLH